MRGRRLPSSSLLGSALLVFFGLSAPVLAGDPGAPPTTDAGVAAGGARSEPSKSDPRTAEVRALIGGTLDVSIDPRTLFDVPLGDDEAVRLESARIRTLLAAIDDRATQPPSGSAAPSASALPGASAIPSATPGPSAGAPTDEVDPALWRARIELDRARLAFYSLTKEHRKQLLDAHEARQVAARPAETNEQRRSREAEEDRQRALDAAKSARSEAERLVGEEVTRLVGIERAVEAARERFRVDRTALADRKELLLGWQRRVRDAKTTSATDADETYDALRRTLRTSRDELTVALEDAASSTSEVPPLGPNPLSEVPSDIPTDQARERRAIVERAEREAAADEHALREERAAALFDEVTLLNRERLGLIASLSPTKRAALTGFTGAGLDQARSEARQLSLILSYHRHIAASWVRSIRQRDGVRGVSAWTVAAVVVPWLLVGFAFIWWRRKSPALLRLVVERTSAQERAERRSTPSVQLRALRFLQGVHRPLEWLAFVGITIWLLPSSAGGLLEVQLLTTIVGWTLGGAFIVDGINALAAVTDHSRGRSAGDAGHLRLRSLRLVGRVVVALVLTLVLSSRLVGQGTVYAWVLSTCWFAAIPVFLVLIRWWRETVFERVERVRRKSRMQQWALANRTGWKSFQAAMIAGVHLFAVGAFKTFRHWIGEFEVARRALAYLFKRELDRLAEGKPSIESRPLGAAALASLSPDGAGGRWVTCPADETLARLRSRALSGKGGVVAIIGPRGMGKSTLLRRMELAVEGAIALSCDKSSSVATIGAALTDAIAASDAEAARSPRLVLVDEAHALVKPVMRGLRSFDEVLAFVRARSEATLWVFAIDSVVWPFLRRARDARPMFDENIVLPPWTDDQIGELLTNRSEEAGISPTFEELLEKLPPMADEVDKQEALAAKRAGYFRMVWDYSRGNPAVALEAWRSSLAIAPDERTVVRPLQAPNPAPLESLPDATLFILRAALQMAPATRIDLTEATRLSAAQVENALKFGAAHGYLHEEDGKVRVTWAWLRSITLFLERRHLLVNS